MRRKLPALIMLLVLLVSSFQMPALASPETYNPETPQVLSQSQLYAGAAILIDQESGDILFNKNEKIRMYPASTTKIMTLLLALESGIELNREITIPQAASNVPSDSSLIPVFPGEHMTFGDLLTGFMVNSGNDGANAIAVLVSGSIEAFVNRMNQRAAEIGCRDTHFVNAHGYHDVNHYSTAYDLAMITREALENDMFRYYVDTMGTARTVYVRERGNINITPRNEMLLDTTPYYYAECIGVKTGKHSAAGKCFVGAAEKEGAVIISVVLKCDTDEQKWLDTEKLFDFGWHCYDTYTLDQIYNVARSQIASFVISNAAEDDPYNGSLLLDIAQISNAEYMRMVEKNNTDALSVAVNDFISRSRVEILHDLTAPISAGEIVGNFTYQDKSTNEIITARLVASRDVAEYVEKTTLIDIFPFLRIFESQIFKVLLIVLLVLIVLIIILVISNRAAKQRRRRRIYEQRRREYLRRQQMQARNARENYSRPPSGHNGYRPSGSSSRPASYRNDAYRRDYSRTGSNKRRPY